MASALPWLEPMHFPSGVCTVKGGVLLADLMDFTTLNIFLLSSVELMSSTRRSARLDAISHSRWLICLKMSVRCLHNAL